MIRVSVADLGCLSRIRIFAIPDPDFPNPESRIPSMISSTILEKFKKLMI